MGRNKALLPWRGVLLLESIAGRVAAAAGAVTVVGDPAIYTGLGFPVIPDSRPNEGPLVGIHTALTHTNSEWNLIVACDMPEIRTGFLRHLLDLAERRDADAVVPRQPSGRLEPVCAVYHRRTLPVVEAALDGGVRRVTEALARLVTIELPVTEGAGLNNVNTPEEWSRYAAN